LSLGDVKVVSMDIMMNRKGSGTVILDVGQVKNVKTIMKMMNEKEKRTKGQ